MSFAKAANQTYKHFLFLSKALPWVLLCTLLGCEHYIPKDEPIRLPKKVMSAADHDIVALEKSLKQDGIKVISVGSKYLISIPTSRIFAQRSPRIRWSSYERLNLIACYLKSFRKIAVNITGYGEMCYFHKREEALTVARARAVGDYLLSQGIDSRFIFTAGAGDDKPIVSTARDQVCESSENARIEITFEEALI